jgi:hypothetical protein
MKKTLATMAIVIVISLLFASDFYIGVQSGLSPRGTNYWSYCADSLFSLIKHAEFNNTMTEITHDNHLVPLMDKLNVDGIKTVLVDQRIDNSIAPSTWKSPTALALSNYWRFEAEFSSSFDVDGGTQDRHWYCSDSRDTLRAGSIDDQSGPYSNEYRWKAEPSSSLPNGGWVLSNLGRRWPRNGDPDYRIGDEFQFTGRHYFDNDTTFVAYLANNYLYISFAFSFDDYATLTSADSLLSFDIVGYTDSTFTVLDHENVTLGVSGDLSVLTKGQYDSLPDDGTYGTNKLLTLRISLYDMEDSGFLAHKDGNYWKLLMGNISPRVYWHGNATLNLDYLDFYDSVYDELQAVTVSTNGGINYLTSVSDLFNTHGNTITNVYGFNEPKQPQIESHGLIERKLRTHLVGTVDGGSELFTSIHDSYIDYIKIGGVPFDNPSLFLDTAMPKLFMPNLYYLEAKHNFNDTTHPSVQGQLTKLHNSYKRYKLNLEQEASLADTKYYICTQSMGTWFGEQTVPYWSWLRLPKETQKAIQLLPLCYGVDGIHSFFFQSWNASENITRYWAAVNVPELTNPSSISLSGAYWGLKEANEKIKVYGPLLSSDRTHDAGTSPQLKWEDSFAINQSEDPIAYFDGQIISLPSIGLSGMNVKTSPGLYQGIVHAGIYTNQATGLPSIMLVNRRANYFDTDMGADNPINIPPSLLDNFFIAADTLTTKFLTNQTANTLAGTYPSFYDPYTNEIHVSSNDVIEVDIGPGDGKLMQMCSSLPSIVTSNADVKNIAYLSGSITIDQGAVVTIHPGTVTKIFAHSSILVKGGSSLKISGAVEIADSVSIIVEDGSDIAFNDATCNWGIDSFLRVDDSEIAATNTIFQSITAGEKWKGLRITNAGTVTMTSTKISGAISNEVTDSQVLLTDCRFTIPTYGTGLSIANTLPGQSIRIIATTDSIGFYGAGTGNMGLYYDNPYANLFLHGVVFEDLWLGLANGSNPALGDTIQYCQFSNNSTGMHLFGLQYSPLIQNCAFFKNDLGAYVEVTSPKVVECDFTSCDIGIRTELSTAQSGGIFDSNFSWGDTGIESRGSNQRVADNKFYTNTGILNHAGSILNMGNTAKNLFQAEYENLKFQDTSSYTARVQLYGGHNDFYHKNPGPFNPSLDFRFDVNWDVGGLFKSPINASYNWFEDGIAKISSPGTPSDYAYCNYYDPSPNVYLENNERMAQALSAELAGNYLTANDTYKTILNENEISESELLYDALDAYYRTADLAGVTLTGTESYLLAKIAQYDSDNPILTKYLQDYLVKNCLQAEAYQTAIDLLELRILNAESPVDSLHAVMNLEIVLQLAAMSENKKPISTKYTQYVYPDRNVYKAKHQKHWDLLEELLNGTEEDLIPIPNKALISSNYPNPFNPSTTIAFSIPKDGLVRIGIYNVKGQKVRDLYDSEMLRGHHKVVWDGKDKHQRDVSSGIYFVKMQASGAISTRKIMLMK